MVVPQFFSLPHATSFFLQRLVDQETTSRRSGAEFHVAIVGRMKLLILVPCRFSLLHPTRARFDNHPTCAEFFSDPLFSPF